MCRIRLYPIPVAKRIENAIYNPNIYENGITPFDIPEHLFMEEFPAIMMDGIFITVYHEMIIRIPPAVVVEVKKLND